MKASEMAEILWKQLDQTISCYPDQTAAVNKHTEKTAFFPVGNGVYNQSESDIEIDILILGQDFGTVNNTKSITDGNSEDTSGSTWNNMIKLYNKAGITPERCFFSNVFMGLRTTNKMTGCYPGCKDKECRKQNLEFLKYQIKTVNPRAIITLGKIPAEMLSECTSPKIDLWNGDHLVGNVKLSPELSCVCASLVHPSMRNSNLGKRYNGDYVKGNEAEIKMLETVIDIIDKQ